MQMSPAHLLSVIMLSGFQQLWDQAAPAVLQQLFLQRHLSILTHPLLVGGIKDWVQTCLRDQFLLEQRRPGSASSDRSDNTSLLQNSGIEKKWVVCFTFSLIMSYNMVTMRVRRTPPPSALNSSDRTCSPPCDRK